MIPRPELQLVTILDLQDIEKAKEVSLVAVIFEVMDPQTYHCRDGLTRTVQQVILVDDSKRSVTLSLWTDYLNKLDGTEGTAVIIIENVVTKEYRGLRTLSTTSTSILRPMSADPTLEQTYLQSWWNGEGKEDEFADIPVPEDRALEQQPE